MRWIAPLSLVLLIFPGSGFAYSRYSASSDTRRISESLRRTDRHVHAAAGQAGLHHARAFWSALSASADGSAECDLCGGKQQWLLVLAKSQEVSQPAVEILNSVPGYHLTSTEKHSSVGTLHELYQVATQINERNLISDPAWKSNPISENRLLCSLQTFARELMVGAFEESKTSVIGFSEVRNTTDQNGTQLDFVSKLFPCGRFVLQADEEMGVDAEPRMALIKANPLISAQSWQETFMRNHTRSSFILAEEYSAAQFNKMLDWLGVQGCHFQEVPTPMQLSQAGKADGMRIKESARAQIAGDCWTPKWHSESVVTD